MQFTWLDVLFCEWTVAIDLMALQTVCAFGAGNDSNSCMFGSIDDLGLRWYDLFLKLLLWSKLKHPILSRMRLIVIVLNGTVHIDHWWDVAKHSVRLSDILSFIPAFLGGHDAIIFANLSLLLIFRVGRILIFVLLTNWFCLKLWRNRFCCFFESFQFVF